MNESIADLRDRWSKANTPKAWEEFAIEMCPHADPEDLRILAWECFDKFENGKIIWKEYFILDLMDFSDSLDNIYKMCMLLVDDEEAAREYTETYRDHPLPMRRKFSK